MARKKKSGPVATATDHAPKAVNQTAPADSEVARRAYELYLARNCQHGHDVDDWLQAERELRGAVSVAVA